MIINKEKKKKSPNEHVNVCTIKIALLANRKFETNNVVIRPNST